MPSYRNNTLPSYYENFPKINFIPGAYMTNAFEWTNSREQCRSKNKPVFHKMCILARAVQAISRYNKEHSESLAVDILAAERVKAKEDQNFGNLLAVLRSKVGDEEKDINLIITMFDFILGWVDVTDTTNKTFNTLLNIVIDYATDNQLTIRSEVLMYSTEHRGTAGSLHSYPSLESVAESEQEGTATTPPTAYTPKLKP